MFLLFELYCYFPSCTVWCFHVFYLEIVMNSFDLFSKQVFLACFHFCKIVSLLWIFLLKGILGELSTCIAHSGKEEPNESDQFQGLPEAILSSLPSCLKIPGVFRTVTSCILRVSSSQCGGLPSRCSEFSIWWHTL